MALHTVTHVKVGWIYYFSVSTAKYASGISKKGTLLFLITIKKTTYILLNESIKIKMQNTITQIGNYSFYNNKIVGQGATGLVYMGICIA